MALWLWRFLKLNEILDRHVPQGKETICPGNIVAIKVISRWCKPCFKSRWYSLTGPEDLLGIRMAKSSRIACIEGEIET